MNLLKLSIVILLLFCSRIFIHGQVPQIPKFEEPKPATFNNTSVVGNSPTQNNSTQGYSQKTIYTPSTTVQYYNNQKALSTSVLDEIKEDLKASDYKSTTLKCDLPSNLTKPEASAYLLGATKIRQMLNGETALDLKTAVFTTENAFFNNAMSYTGFNNTIKDMASYCLLYMKQKKYPINNNLAKIMTLFQYFTDTLSLKVSGYETPIVHYPFKYDFDDYRGDKDWRKMFVSKLVNENTGQCHSLPLLFLILAREIGAKAWLSVSPEHTYIKFQDDNKRWYNIELTNGMLTADAWVSGSGYVKAEAIKSGIYMDTLSLEQSIAMCLTDLAKGYTMKYWYDSFVLENINEALKHYPNNIYALGIKSDYYTFRFFHIIKQLGYPSIKPNIEKYPEALNAYNQMHNMYDLIDRTGYEPMPKEAYEQWLKSLEQEKQKQEHQTKYINLQKNFGF